MWPATIGYVEIQGQVLTAYRSVDPLFDLRCAPCCRGDVEPSNQVEPPRLESNGRSRRNLRIVAAKCHSHSCLEDRHGESALKRWQDSHHKGKHTEQDAAQCRPP
jgi:hypothetical protein